MDDAVISTTNVANAANTPLSDVNKEEVKVEVVLKLDDVQSEESKDIS